jgi:hypothetical protein
MTDTHAERLLAAMDRLADALELHNKPLLTANEAADMLGASVPTLAKVRAALAQDGRDIAFTLAGTSTVRYSRRAIELLEAEALGLPERKVSA